MLNSPGSVLRPQSKMSVFGSSLNAVDIEPDIPMTLGQANGVTTARTYVGRKQKREPMSWMERELHELQKKQAEEKRAELEAEQLRRERAKAAEEANERHLLELFQEEAALFGQIGVRELLDDLRTHYWKHESVVTGNYSNHLPGDAPWVKLSFTYPYLHEIRERDFEFTSSTKIGEEVRYEQTYLRVSYHREYEERHRDKTENSKHGNPWVTHHIHKPNIKIDSVMDPLKGLTSREQILELDDSSFTTSTIRSFLAQDWLSRVKRGYTPYAIVERQDKDVALQRLLDPHRHEDKPQDKRWWHKKR